VYWNRTLSEEERAEIASELRWKERDALLSGRSESAARALYESAVAHRIAELAPAEPVVAGEVAGDTGHFTVTDLQRGGTYQIFVRAIGRDGSASEAGEAPPLEPTRQIFDGSRVWLLLFAVAIAGAVLTFISIARSGRPLKIRKIAGLEAVDEAVGRATEMGRPILFVAGIQDMNDMMTLAGLTALSRVAKTAAEYDAKLEVPTSRSLVMTAARETVHAAYLAAGRPDSYREDLIYYVTDEQFGFVAYLTGHMVREKPAACFYLGAFYAESLILAETGNAIGAIQIAGTAETAQLPFFVAACDYTLIGEEFFAASAYLSGEPEQLGSLRGQDIGKIIAAIGIVAGCVLATLAIMGNPGNLAGQWLDTFRDTILQ
jgi:hypothetical protein